MHIMHYNCTIINDTGARSYEQAKKHIFSIVSQQKSVTLNSRMNSANNYVEVINTYVFSSWVVQLNPSTQHTAMVQLSRSVTFNESSSAHSTLINPTVVQVLKKCDDWERRIGYFLKKKKKK